MTIVSEIPNFYSENTRLGIVDFLDNELESTWQCNKTSAIHPDSIKNRRSTYTALPFFSGEHKRLTHFDSKLFDEPLRPTYTCLASYDRADLGKSLLTPHIDRDQCYRTLTYMIRCDDVPNWPMHVGKWELTDQERSDILSDRHELKEHPKPGKDIDAIINFQEWSTLTHLANSAAFFSGTHRWHYRDEIPAGRADVIMFHYNPV